jgi:hypothetical protein
MYEEKHKRVGEIVSAWKENKCSEVLLYLYILVEFLRTGLNVVKDAFQGDAFSYEANE